MKKIILVLIAFSPFTAFSQITVADYPKKISCDVDATFELPAPAATSPCGEVTSTFDDQLFSGGCLGTLVRNYVYSDGCGASATADQYILITDNAEPVLIGVPDSISEEVALLPEAPMVSARDNSGQVVDVSFSETLEGKKLIRTWSSTDACGNTATARQMITLRHEGQYNIAAPKK